MSRLDAWLLHVANTLVGGTGLVYAWMRYVLKPLDEFAVVHHPWQPLVQHLHIWTAPLLVFVFGHMWYAHTWSYLRSPQREGRRSGTTLFALAVPMILSGYFIQTAVTDAWRLTWVVVHCTTSGAWLLSYGGHLVSHWRARVARARKR